MRHIDAQGGARSWICNRTRWNYKIRSAKRIFTTATPRYFGKAIKDAAKAKDLAVVGMDDEEVFGSVLHKLTFGKAIQDGHLTDYQVVIIGVDEPMVKQNG